MKPSQTLQMNEKKQQTPKYKEVIEFCIPSIGLSGGIRRRYVLVTEDEKQEEK